MVRDQIQKDKAIALRRSGMSYGEILKEIPVAKSTLSLWLRDVGLAKRQMQVLSEKRRAAALRGAAKRREQRLTSIHSIELLAKKEFSRFVNKSLWLAGVMLYWAEGAKQKITNVSQAVKFSNSDSGMVKLFLKWLIEICEIARKEIKCELYIHQNGRIKEASNYWNQQLTPFKVDAIYFKRSKVIVSRKNVNDQYHGLITVRVLRSTELNRRISAWIKLFLKEENIGE